MLRSENDPLRVSGMFYKATVQAVLLFGSETWSLSTTAMDRLEGFHIRAAWRMALVNKPRKDPTSGTWTYPPSEDALEEVGLHTIADYVQVRRQTIANFIVNRPIFNFCVDGERKRGTCPHHFWWEQPMDLDAARASAIVAANDEELGSDGD